MQLSIVAIALSYLAPPYAKDFVLKFLGQKSTKNYTVPLNTFELYDNGNGSLLFLGQHFYNNYGDGYFIYGGFAPAIIQEGGSIEWLPILKKSTHLVGLDIGCGDYSYAFVNNKHYLLYIDKEKNSPTNYEEKVGICKQCKGDVLRAFVIDENGKVIKKNVYDVAAVTKEVGGSFYTHHIKQVSDNEIIFEANKGKKEAVLIKLQLD